MNHPRPTDVPPASANLIFGIGGLVTTLAIVAFVTALGGRPASATIAFAKDTGRRCSACHATPGTDMVPLTALGQCFSNNNDNIQGCQ